MNTLTPAQQELRSHLTEWLGESEFTIAQVESSEHNASISLCRPDKPCYYKVKVKALIALALAALSAEQQLQIKVAEKTLAADAKHDENFQIDPFGDLAGAIEELMDFRRQASAPTPVEPPSHGYSERPGYSEAYQKANNIIGAWEDLGAKYMYRANGTGPWLAAASASVCSMAGCGNEYWSLESSQARWKLMEQAGFDFGAESAPVEPPQAESENTLTLPQQRENLVQLFKKALLSKQPYVDWVDQFEKSLDRFESQLSTLPAVEPPSPAANRFDQEMSELRETEAAPVEDRRWELVQELKGDNRMCFDAGIEAIEFRRREDNILTSQFYDRETLADLVEHAPTAQPEPVDPAQAALREKQIELLTAHKLLNLYADEVQGLDVEGEYDVPLPERLSHLLACFNLRGEELGRMDKVNENLHQRLQASPSSPTPPVESDTIEDEASWEGTIDGFLYNLDKCIKLFFGEEHSALRSEAVQICNRLRSNDHISTANFVLNGDAWTNPRTESAKHLAKMVLDKKLVPADTAAVAGQQKGEAGNVS